MSGQEKKTTQVQIQVTSHLLKSDKALVLVYIGSELHQELVHFVWYRFILSSNDKCEKIFFYNRQECLFVAGNQVCYKNDLFHINWFIY